jgi:tetratricopeptide (TPR) repeat protein
MVLDWGLAKVLRPEHDSQPTTPETPPPVVSEESGLRGATLHGQVLGTPGYMAPEQAEGRQDLVGERTDVYGLGAILYEILTGRVPFSGSDTQDLLQRVVHEPPERPRAVVPGVSPGLEAVCLKALAKQPAGRYPSAKALADEVRHWLADEPVTAYAEPWAARARRWMGRHRTLVTAAAAAVLVAVVSLAASTVLLGDANRRIQDALAQARVSRDEAREQRAQAEANAKEAERQRDQSRANFQLARDAVDEYCTKVSDDPRLKERDLEALRKELLQTATKFHERFLQRHQNDPQQKADLGRAYRRLAKLSVDVGDRDKGTALYRQALDVFAALTAGHAESAEYLDELAQSNRELAGVLLDTGQRPDAARAYERAHVIWEKLVKEHPDRWDYAVKLGKVYSDLGDVTRRDGQPEAGVRLFRRSVETLEPVYRQHPDDDEAERRLAGTYYGLANSYRAMGNPKQGLPVCLKAMPLYERLMARHPNFAVYEEDYSENLHVLALIYQELDEMDKALATMRKSLAVMRHAAASHPALTSLRLNVAGTMMNLAIVYHGLHRMAEAEDNLQQALAVYREFTARWPGVLQYRLELTLVYMNLARFRIEDDRLDEAADLYHLVADILAGLDLTFPRVLEQHMALSRAYLDLVQGYVGQGRPKRVATLVPVILALRQRLAGARPKTPEQAVDCGGACCNAGYLLALIERPQDARASFDDAVRVLGGVLDKDTKHARARDFLGNTYIGLAELEKAKDPRHGNPDVEKLYRRAVAAREELVADHPQEARYQASLANLEHAVAASYQEAGRPQQALAWHTRALKRRERLHAEQPGKDPYQADVALGLYHLAGAHEALHRLDDALACARRAQDIDDRLVAAHPKEDRYRRELAMIYGELGMLQVRHNDVAAALPLFEREADLHRQLAQAHPGALPQQIDFGRTQRKLGECYLLVAKADKAAPALAEAAALFDRLAPSVRPAALAAFRGEQAQTHAALGKAYAHAGRREDAFAAFDRAAGVMAKLTPTAPALVLCRAAVVEGCVRLGQQSMREGKNEPALQAFRRAQEPARLLVAAQPKNVSYQDQLIAAYVSGGSLEAMSGKVDDALATYRRAVPLIAPLDARRPPVLSAHAALVKNFGNLGDHYAARNKAELAAEAFELALAEARKLAAAQSNETGHLGTIGFLCRKLAPVYFVLREPERGLRTYREELSAYQQLSARRPGFVVATVLCGAAHHDVGHALHALEKHSESLGEFDRAIAVLDGTLKGETPPQLRQAAAAWMCTSQQGRAHALWHLKRYAESAAAYDKAMPLAKPNQRAAWLPEHATVLARTGAYTRAAAEAEEVAGLKSAAGMALYNAACALALASADAGKDNTLPAAERKRLAARYAASAVAVLGKAKTAGLFKDPSRLAHMKQDADLDSVRRSAEYRRLVAELEKLAKDGPK